jgi:hypothetical protein
MNKYWQEKGNPDLTNKRKALSRPTEDEKLHLQTPAFTEAISLQLFLTKTRQTNMFWCLARTLNCILGSKPRTAQGGFVVPTVFANGQAQGGFVVPTFAASHDVARCMLAGSQGCIGITNIITPPLSCTFPDRLLTYL